MKQGIKNDISFKFWKKAGNFKKYRFNFEVIPANIDETSDKSDILLRKSRGYSFFKGKAYCTRVSLINMFLAADTIVEKIMKF